MGAWSGCILHYKKGMPYKTTADSTSLYQDAPVNTLLIDMFCILSTTLPSFRTRIHAGLPLIRTSPSTWTAHILRLMALRLSQRPTFYSSLQRSDQDEQSYAIVPGIRGDWGPGSTRPDVAAGPDRSTTAVMELKGGMGSMLAM